jgi:hypothetical protein
MSDSETPSRQHEAIQPHKASLELLCYQITEVKDDVRSLTKQFNRFMEKTQESESGFIKAVERCSAHGEQIKEIKQQLENQPNPEKSSQVSFWSALAAVGAGSALAAVGAGVGAWLSHFFGKGGGP